MHHKPCGPQEGWEDGQKKRGEEGKGKECGKKEIIEIIGNGVEAKSGGNSRGRWKNRENLSPISILDLRG